jgi:O-acetylhomoserine (thiol)-lyase
MKAETIALHGGYAGDPGSHACAVPIYQTVAFEFDSADHGAALFNLEVPGNIGSRRWKAASRVCPSAPDRLPFTTRS